jgi:hypothetical protein
MAFVLINNILNNLPDKKDCQNHHQMTDSFNKLKDEFRKLDEKQAQSLKNEEVYYYIEAKKPKNYVATLDYIQRDTYIFIRDYIDVARQNGNEEKEEILAKAAAEDRENKRKEERERQLKLQTSLVVIPIPIPAETKPPFQGDFFIANIADCSTKDDQASMEAPLFSLSTRPDSKVWTWTSLDGKKTVSVSGGRYGRAQQHDKDILIFCASQLMAAINANKRPERVVRFTAYDFFKATGRTIKAGGTGYSKFKDSLNRLATTYVVTNSVTGNQRQAQGFNLISGWRIAETSNVDERITAIEVELSQWQYNSIINKEVLTLDKGYFKLRKPLERRLYEIAKKHVGNQGYWEIGLEALRDKCGSTVQRIRRFRDDIEKIIAADALPEYRIIILEGGKVRFYSRDANQLGNAFK